MFLFDKLVLKLLTELDSEEFATYLTDKGLHEDVVADVINNRIMSLLFLDLAESSLKELASAIGDRLALKKILAEV